MGEQVSAREPIRSGGGAPAVVGQVAYSAPDHGFSFKVQDNFKFVSTSRGKINYGENTSDTGNIYLIDLKRELPPRITKFNEPLEAITYETDKMKYVNALKEIRNRYKTVAGFQGKEGFKGDPKVLEFINNYLSSIENAVNK